MTARRAWIESPGYDLPLIALAPLIGLGICAFALGIGEQRLVSLYFVELNFFLLGMPHYLSTYAFALDDSNRDHYAGRKLAFIAGPVILVMLLLASMALHLYHLVAVLIDAYNVFHVSRQSAGILSVYRHRSGGNNLAEKMPANVALIFGAAGMYLTAVGRHRSTVLVFGEWTSTITGVIAPATLTVALIGALVLAWRMKQRGAAGIEWLFLASSIILFTPYLILSDFTLATSALLAGHYIQYLSLLWLINRRKYAGAGGSVLQRSLAFVSRSKTALATLLVSLAIVPLAIDRVVHRFEWNAFHTVWLYVTVLLHYYYDGLFWAFRDPHVRQSLGPFLVRWDNDGGAAPPAAVPVAATR